MADYNELWNQFVGVDPNEDDPNPPVVPLPAPLPYTVQPPTLVKPENLTPALRLPPPSSYAMPQPANLPASSPSGRVAFGEEGQPTIGRGGPDLVLPPPAQPSEEGEREFQASVPRPQPGDPSLTDAAWAERPISGIRNRIKRGFETMALTGLGGQSSPRAALGQMAGSLLTGIIYPKAANAAYQERIAHPRQQREIAEADAKREREYRAQMEQQETQIRAGQIEAQGRTAEAAKWIQISPPEGTVGQDGKRYHVLYNTETKDEKWNLIPPGPKKYHNIPLPGGGAIALDEEGNQAYSTEGMGGKAAQQKPAMSAADAKALAPGELVKEFGKNADQFGLEYWLGRKDSAIKSKADELPGGYDRLQQRAAAGGGKTPDARAALKILQDIAIAQEKVARADAMAAWNGHLSRKEQELMFPGGLPGGQGVKAAGAATPAPTGAPSAAPTGAQPQAGAPPANYTPKPNTSGKLTQAGWQARDKELQQMGMTDQQQRKAIEKQEGWLP